MTIILLGMNINQKIIAVAIAAIFGVNLSMAQQIAEVSPNGQTTMYQTLQKAVEGAVNGSVIYLPAGGFQIPDSVKITKKVSIVGVGHSATTDNADGNTVISGNLFFNSGSNCSTVIGCYISGTVYIGKDGKSVNNIVVKYCNIGNVDVNNSTCTGTVINQSYLRNGSSFNGASATLMNNVINNVNGLTGGIVANNVFVNGSGFSNCSVYQNIFINGQGLGGNVSFGNMAKSDVGDSPVNIGELTWDDLFVKFNNGGVTPASDFQMKEQYRPLYAECGIYGGTGFRNQPPMPFFMAKSIPGQTDADENLVIQVKVKTGE